MLFLLAADFPHARQCVDDAAYTRTELDQRRKGWKQLLESLPLVLSCPVCGMHFKEYMQRHPVDEALVNRDTLFEWLYRVKDDVNRRNNKKSVPLDVVKKKYIPSCATRKKKR